MDDRIDRRLAAAYVRGMAKRGALSLPDDLAAPPLDALTGDALDELLEIGARENLKLYYFKRKDELPRVRKVLGFLRGVRPENLLDVGSGRGAFLFPFMREFPDVEVSSFDVLDRRVELLGALADGGIDRLTASKQDLCTAADPDGAFDVVTLLEVLEHIPDVQAAVTNAVRLARRYVAVTVPSKPDDNPEHIHLLTKPELTRLFENAGARRLRFDGVPNHLFMIADVN